VLAIATWLVIAQLPLISGGRSDAGTGPGERGPRKDEGERDTRSDPGGRGPRSDHALWVVPFDSARAAEMVLAQSLQGVTGRDIPRLWREKNGVMSAIVLRQLEAEGTTLHRVSSVWDLPDDFWQTADGAVLYNLGTHSLNVAVSLAGPWNGVAVD